MLNQSTNLTWVASTIAGVYVGQFIPPGALGVDFALTAMFICLLVFQLRSRLMVAAALLAAVLSVSCYLLVPGNGYVIVASCLAATVGCFLRKRGWR